MIRSNYVQVTRAKATLVNRMYHRVSPARITILRLGDTGYSLQKRITSVRLGDMVPSLQNRITKRLRLGDTSYLLQRRITYFVTKLYHQLLQILSRQKS